MTIDELIEKVLIWGENKGITGIDGEGTMLGQLAKTQEEVTETRDAVVKYIYDHESIYSEDHFAEIEDGIGDCLVTLIILAEMAGLTVESCLQRAYDEIKGRTGKMQKGVFVKDK